jgi:hypothetical protein
MPKGQIIETKNWFHVAINNEPKKYFMPYIKKINPNTELFMDGKKIISVRIRKVQGINRKRARYLANRFLIKNILKKMR